MVQVLQVTLRTAEFKNKLLHSAKALLKLSFGDVEKPFPHPRVIKDQIIRFDGQRMSISSYSEVLIEKALLYISVIESGKTVDYGYVEIDILKLKQYKDGTKVNLELQNQDCIVTLEAFVSVFTGGTSEIDNKSERSESLLSPLRAHSSIGTTGIKQALQNVVQYTPKHQSIPRQQDLSQPQPPQTQTRKESEKLLSKTFDLNKKTSLNYNAPKLIDDDRKSEISERPVRQSIKRTQEAREKEDRSREPSITKSASNIAKNKEPVSAKNIKQPSTKQTERKSEQKPLRQPRSQSKPKPQPKQSQTKSGQSLLGQFQQSDYIQFLIVSLVAFIVGIVFKKL